jgi:hypothetical protein
MIAELAAANAAFDVIKQTIQNGKEIYEAGEALAKYFGLKTEIQKKAHQHGYKSDLEAFMAAEKLKAQEEELKQMMIYQGRAGMWDDWLQFQAQCAQSRKQEEQDRIKSADKRKKALGEIAIAVGLVLFVVIAVTCFVILLF